MSKHIPSRFANQDGRLASRPIKSADYQGSGCSIEYGETQRLEMNLAGGLACMILRVVRGESWNLDPSSKIQDTIEQ